ncbi:MAG TPA: hypothetical protein DCP20_01245 [Coriobacteriia bacterium]|nr:hypothetical protein [Coriobacteriia bacterium]
MENPYQVLGVASTATLAEIKSAYRRLAMQTHPDLHGGSDEHAARFRAVTDAYAILIDPAQRRRFDEGGLVDHERVASAAQDIYAAIAYVRTMAAQAKATARSAALRGVAWLAGGAIITLIGYISAVSSGGGSYPIFYGAIFFGGYQAFRGFAAYVQIDAKARKIERDIWNLVTEGAPA